jgi:hypothetical protein
MARTAQPIDPASHPAVGAWSRLIGKAAPVERIEVLQERKKSLVCRLVGAGEAGAPVIAKRCKERMAAVERPVYEEVLSRLPIPTLRYHGAMPAGPGFSWLFLEDAGGEDLCRDRDVHRRLEATWLGTLHAAAAHLDLSALLPERGPSHYLEKLQIAQTRIVESLDNPALSDRYREMLQRLAERLQTLELSWERVEAWCDPLPRTLVHGDFAPKNVRVRPGPNGLELVAMDWEMAGWSVPAADLEHVDSAIYSSVVRRTWPLLDREHVEVLAHYGRLFRSLIAMSWESHGFRYENPTWQAHRMPWMVRYDQILSAALHGTGLHA